MKAAKTKVARTCEEQAILSRRGKRSRRTGAANELDVCRILRPVCPDVCRALGQSRDGGRDLENTAPFCLELKHQDRPNIMAAFRQADAAKKSGEIPAAITKAKRGEQMITMRLADFVPVMAGFIAYRDSVAIELVVGTEEDEREAENALGQTREPVAVPA